MSDRETASHLLRTPRPRLSRGTVIAYACWGLFLLLFLAGLACLMIRIAGSEDRPISPQTAVTRPLTPLEPGTADDAAHAALLLRDFQFTPNNVRFTAPIGDAPPAVEIHTCPQFSGYSAVWGATGVDHRGHVWLGVSTRVYGEAHLLEFNPHARQLTDHGSVRDQLQRLNAWHKGMSQIKIHSRIVQAPDGFLYFASMDEKGETHETNPVNGSYLWRIHPLKPAQWERIAHVPEALIAVACGGPRVYALGYHGHVLHQYDTRNGRMRSVQVGSVGGHISRNLVVDHRDHAFVPRLRHDAKAGRLIATLVEFDAELQQVGESPLEHYLDPAQGAAASHGIIALQPLADRSIVFTTHGGMLHRITPPDSGDAPAVVRTLGFIHPQGPRYVPTLFTDDGVGRLYALGFRGEGFDWIRFDLTSNTATLAPIDIAYPDQRKLYKHLIYGSITRDAQGGFIVGGTDQNLDRPVIWRLMPKP